MNTRKAFGISCALCSCVLLPSLSAAVSGCNNGYLLGNYNAQVSSLNLTNVIQAMNNTGSTVTPAGGTATPTVVGFGNNPRSISGSLPGTSRFFFDGAGAVVGVTPGTNGATVATGVGTYSVNLDCTATISLTGGATFDAVVAQGGRQVLFLETDSTGAGAVGTLEKASSCVSLNYPQSFAFSFSGATPQSASSSGSTGSGGTGTGSGSGSGGTGTGTTTTASAFSPFSVVGTLATDGNGNFALSETSISNGSTVRSKAGGTYTVDANCGLKLTFSSSNPATTANFKAPVSFQGLTSDANGGVLLMQPDQNTTLAGTFIVQ